MKNHLDPEISADTTNATGTNHSRNCRSGSRYELIVLCAVPVSNPALTGITDKRKHMMLPHNNGALSKTLWAIEQCSDVLRGNYDRN